MRALRGCNSFAVSNTYRGEVDVATETLTYCVDKPTLTIHAAVSQVNNTSYTWLLDRSREVNDLGSKSAPHDACRAYTQDVCP